MGTGNIIIAVGIVAAIELFIHFVAGVESMTPFIVGGIGAIIVYAVFLDD